MIDKGRARKYCKDDISKIENYEQAINDKTQTWDCHHRLELTINDEHARTKEELIRLGMYYNRPYFELIFLTRKEHKKLEQNTNYARQKNREAQLKVNRKGSNNPMSAENVTEKRKTNPYFGKRSKYKVFVHYAKSEEGRKIINHFGLKERTKESEKLYYSEMAYYKINKKFSWE